MEKKFNYKTSGVCSREIQIVVEDGLVKDVKFVGGCSGNTQGVAKLVVGLPVEKVIDTLKGVSCGGRPTSCPDQLACALEIIRAAEPKKSAPEYRERFSRWLASPAVDSAFKKELVALEEAHDEKEIEYRFTAPLAFGTGGLRGIMKAGINAMNRYTVAHATQGLAGLILDEKGADKGVVIAHDSRNNSPEFAKIAAETLAANGIKVYFFDALRPTPELSFAIRRLGAISGINVTASHNPKAYNGYKAYWEDGAQLSPEQADVVSGYISRTDIFDGVKNIAFDEAKKSGLITVIGEEIDRAYLDAVFAEQVNKNAISAVADSLKIVYTPLHGAGYKLVPEVLRRAGLRHLHIVAEQSTPDGNFPTVPKPNPEYPEVYGFGISLARDVGSDLVIATDPDADRIGVMAKKADGTFACINGNQMGALLLDYIITAYEKNGGLPKDAYAVKTIVSTELVSAICAAHKVKLYNVLTGFKFIGEVIKKHEQSGEGHFIFGFEESYGYLKGTYARDKDSVVAALLVVEMAAYYKGRNMTLLDALDALYKKYGDYSEITTDIYMEGLDGLSNMKKMMDNRRKNPPKSINGVKIVELRDYQTETVTDLVTGKTSPTGLPKSNVLYYKDERGNVVVVRPSGTEPKVKIYALAVGLDAKPLAEAAKKAITE